LGPTGELHHGPHDTPALVRRRHHFWRVLTGRVHSFVPRS
jgi:hypothetical protein